MSNTDMYILCNKSSEKSIKIAKKIKAYIDFLTLEYSKYPSFENGFALEYQKPDFFISIEIDSEGEIYILYKKLFKFAGTKKVSLEYLNTFLKRILKFT